MDHYYVVLAVGRYVGQSIRQSICQSIRRSVGMARFFEKSKYFQRGFINAFMAGSYFCTNNACICKNWKVYRFHCEFWEKTILGALITQPYWVEVELAKANFSHGESYLSGVRPPGRSKSPFLPYLRGTNWSLEVSTFYLLANIFEKNITDVIKGPIATIVCLTERSGAKFQGVC